MLRFYYVALVCATIFLSYFIGGHVGAIRCREHIANNNAKQIILDTKKLESVNEVAFHTGVNDIRHILREKYTIAE